MRFLLLAALTCSATTAFASAAFAQDADTEQAGPNAALDAQDLDEAARLLFESGTRSYDAGDFDEALSRYTTAYELSGRSALLYNIAICHDRLEHKEEAAAFYERFLVENPDSPRAGVSRSRAAILRASLAGSDAAIVSDEPVEPNEPTEPTEPTPEAVAPAPAEHASSRSLAGPIASFGVAGAGLITFAVGAGLSSSRLSACEDTPCDTDGLDAVDRASLVADIGLSLAIAGAAVGVIWWLVGRDDDDEGLARTQVLPAASASTVGAQVMGSF